MSLDNLGAGDYSTFAFEISALVRMNLLIVVKTLGAGASPLQEVVRGAWPANIRNLHQNLFKGFRIID